MRTRCGNDPKTGLWVGNFFAHNRLCYTATMNMLRHMRPDRQTAPRHRHLRVMWRNGILLAYIGLLALVLPFICWGAWADPSHPHGGPHFVFAPPPLRTSTHLASQHLGAEQPRALDSICGDAEALRRTFGDAAFQPPTASRGGSSAGADESPVAGQSLPDSSLVVASLLLVFAAATGLVMWRRFNRRLALVLSQPCVELRVPTPPPRLWCAELAVPAHAA